MKFSTLAQEDIFSDKFGATSVAIIEDFFSVDDIAYMDVDKLAEFLTINLKAVLLILMNWLKPSRKLPEVLIGCLKRLMIL